MELLQAVRSPLSMGSSTLRYFVWSPKAFSFIPLDTLSYSYFIKSEFYMDQQLENGLSQWKILLCVEYLGRGASQGSLFMAS